MVENCLVVFKCLWLDCNDLQRYTHTLNGNNSVHTIQIAAVTHSDIYGLFEAISLLFLYVIQMEYVSQHQPEIIAKLLKQLKIYAFCPNKSG